MLISSFLTPGNSASTWYSLSFSDTSMRNCVGAGARVSGIGSHMGTPRNKLSNASSIGLKRVMFTILFSYVNTNQSAAKTVHPFPLYGGAIATLKFCISLEDD